MAAIGIYVQEDGYKIYMDRFEWTGLQVNGNNVERDGNEWNFIQSGFEEISFTATGRLTATNPGNVFVLEGDHNHDFVCAIWYNNNPFELHGKLFRVGKVTGAGPGNFDFTQGNMSGWFGKE